MTRSYIPLNSLRAFEAAARHLSFTHAAIELNVTHSAISQQVKALEQHLNCQLFVRVSRGLMLTTEGENLLPVLNDSFDRIAGMLDRFSRHRAQENSKSALSGPLPLAVYSRCWRIFAAVTRILTSSFPRITTGSIRLPKGWITPSATVAVHGTALRPFFFAQRRWPSLLAGVCRQATRAR
jgi:DNA-binding transcriptional LysR family regulator